MSSAWVEVQRLMSKEASDASGSLLLLAAAGSRAYGTDHAESDYDFRGIYMASLPRVLSMAGAKQSLAMTEPHDAVVYELSHFCKLAAAANPTALEVLWADFMTGNLSSPGLLLRKNRHLFLSKLVARTYGGYAISQLKKAAAGSGGSRGQNQYKRPKFKLHTLRLLDAGVAALKTGEIQVRVPDPARLLEQASGHIELLAEQRLKEMQEAESASSLPERPDTDAIDRLIYEMRTSNG